MVPDLGNELPAVMVELEELLLTYAAWESAGEVDPGELPAPIAGGAALAALAALRRIWHAVAPLRGGRRHPGRLHRPPAGPGRPP
ncbi:hypothetical protein [Planobispora siamensis]|uniref:hypothetical protein n=1 Tax=Planobispora siamensis TaxID=936338 RepID=UPI001EF34403|nr:hypothetical protein [Planobispora siamensis]